MTDNANSALQRPKWKKWTQMKFVELWQAVALSCDIEPRAIHLDPNFGIFRTRTRFMGDADFYERLDIALADGGTGFELVEPEDDDEVADRRKCRVRLGAFGAWAVSLEWRPFPEEFPCDEPGEPQGWPWGKYSTKALGYIAAAVWKFYRNHNPKRPNDNVPDNADVEAFLVDIGASAHMAEAITAIIRPDAAKRGRRQRKGGDSP